MKHKNILTYSISFDLSNKYSEVIIQYLENKILNEKYEILFDFFIL